jgi:hypothetical protein
MVRGLPVFLARESEMVRMALEAFLSFEINP